MGWTEPTQRSTGDLITQAIYNTDLVDNLAYLRQVVEPGLTNKSGGSVEAGDVVKADISNDQAFTTTTTLNDPNVIGVAMETIANNAQGRVALCGVVVVKVQGNVTRGNLLAASTTAKRARDAGVTRMPYTFAMALTNYSGGGAGSVVAVLLPGFNGEGIPANGIIYITGTTVPAGFSEYTAARGRVIVGLPGGGTPEGTVGTALTNLESQTHTHTYTSVTDHTHTIKRAQGTSGASYTGISILTDRALAPIWDSGWIGNTGGVSPSTQATSHMMPYIQLLAIKKN